MTEDLRMETENLSVLARDLTQAWTRAHGAPTATGSPLAGSDGLAVRIDDAFSEAERYTATSPAGRVLVQQYTELLLEQVGDDLITRVEGALDRSVVSTGVASNVEAGWVMVYFQLGERLSPDRGAGQVAQSEG
jgi:hypothetical protein